MTRLLLQALLLVLPLILYWGYVRFVAEKKEESQGTWNEAPLTLLIASGIVLVLLSFVYFALTTGVEPGSRYQPAQMKDGELIPGKMIPPEDAAQDE